MRRRRNRSPLLVGAALIAVIVIASFLATTKDVPFLNEPYIVKAAFTDSSGIANGSPVRIAGVQVGKVRKVEHAERGARAAIVTMAINDNGRPVAADAEATIRPRIFLEGNFFIDLEPGPPGTRELGDGATIPVAQTGTPVQLDQVLKTLKADVRADLRTTFAELFIARQEGAGRAFNRSLRHQPAAYRFSAIVAEALLGERPGDLGDLIRDQGIVSAALDRSPEDLVGLIVDFNTTAAALGDNADALRATARELPRTLSIAQPTLAALNAAFPAVRRFARSAVEPVRSLGPTSVALTPFVRQLRGLVSASELRGLAADLRTATPPAARLTTRAVGLLGQLRPLASCTTQVLVPYGNDTVPDANFPATGPVHEEIPKSLVGLAGESRSHDANGQWFKVLGAGGPQTFDLGGGLMGTSAQPMRGVNPPPQRQRPPLRGDVPCETQEPPDLRTDPAAAPPTVRTDPSSARARSRTARAQTTAVVAMRRLLKLGGSDLQVRDRPATARDISAARAALGRRGAR